MFSYTYDNWQIHTNNSNTITGVGTKKLVYTCQSLKTWQARNSLYIHDEEIKEKTFYKWFLDSCHLGMTKVRHTTACTHTHSKSIGGSSFLYYVVIKFVSPPLFEKKKKLSPTKLFVILGFSRRQYHSLGIICVCTASYVWIYKTKPLSDDD